MHALLPPRITTSFLQSQVNLLLSLFIFLSESVAQASTMVSSSAPSVYSVQALVLLAEVGRFLKFSLWQKKKERIGESFLFLCCLTHFLTVQILAPLLDMVYRSDEKEKAVPLISRLMYYVFPYLKNHR